MTRTPLAGAPDGVAVAQVDWSSTFQYGVDDAPDTVLSAVPGRIYRVTASARALGAVSVGQPFDVAVRERDSTGVTLLRQWSSTGTLGNAFVQRQAFGTVQRAGDRIDVYVVEGNGAAGHSFYVDAIALVDVTGQSTVVAGDDFDDGMLQDAQAPWASVTAVVPNSWAVSAVAAHRGAAGARFTDSISTGTPNVEGALYAIPQNVLSGDTYLRFWARVQLMGAADSIYLAELLSNGGFAQLEVLLDLPSHRVRFGGYDSSAVLTVVDAGFTLPNAEWHLFEAAVLNTGPSPNLGNRRLWVDGVLKVDQGPFSFGDSRRLGVGAAWSDTRATTGTIDVDDVRLSCSPPASRLTVSAPATIARGGCTAVTVGLVDSSGAPAAAPYPVTVALSISGAATAPYSDANCMVSTTTGVIPVDALGADVYLRGNALGAAQLSVAQADFLPGSAAYTIVVGPDAGAVDGGSVDGGSVDGGAVDGGAVDGGSVDGGEISPRALAVGCGCGSAQGSALIVLLAALALRRRALYPDGRPPR
ncbi:MAG: hypothetical protein IPJ65_43845 [Archangiaceae bacterium]|nr:hypothetical protein [Archangiaceae bacterium]